MSTLRRDNGIPAPRAPEPVNFRMDRIVLAGMGVWAVALVLTLIIPALHRGDRHWWPWACVAGIGLGLIGYLYVRRGRGNAADAHPVPQAADPQSHY
ncbi:MAG: DUF2530 domain-containing protein [Actinobacteria bacterium]|uniref:DUF2530 domain-containing protein n=1 Tax=Nostocoides veronense TaxID=330836 RepID=A0ABN2LRL1_9MICO|nr:DUF2530 domain-containing protein [Actinomycetota bacterium]